MDSIYKKVAGLHIIPAVINIAGTVFVFFNYNVSEFTGYISGALLGIILSIVWVMQINKVVDSHAIKLMKITFKGLLVKVAIFFVYVAIVYAVFEFSIVFFAASFFIALFISAIIEIWFYSTLIKKNKKY
jgi:hypothetical protein